MNYNLVALGGGASTFGPSGSAGFNVPPWNTGNLIEPCERFANRGRLRPQDRWRQGYLDRSKRVGKLFCRTGYHLEIKQDGRIRGTQQDNTKFGILEFMSVAFGLVAIRGQASQQYLCMARQGKLKGQSHFGRNCIFMERMLENLYNTYASCAFSRKGRLWHIAINRRGKIRRASTSRRRKKYAQFLFIHLDSEPSGQQLRIQEGLFAWKPTMLQNSTTSEAPSNLLHPPRDPVVRKVLHAREKAALAKTTDPSQTLPKSGDGAQDRRERDAAKLDRQSPMAGYLPTGWDNG